MPLSNVRPCPAHNSVGTSCVRCSTQYISGPWHGYRNMYISKYSPQRADRWGDGSSRRNFFSKHSLGPGHRPLPSRSMPSALPLSACSVTAPNHALTNFRGDSIAPRLTPRLSHHETGSGSWGWQCSTTSDTPVHHCRTPEHPAWAGSGTHKCRHHTATCADTEKRRLPRVCPPPPPPPGWNAVLWQREGTQEATNQMLVSGPHKTIGPFLPQGRGGRVPGIRSPRRTHSLAAVCTAPAFRSA